MVSCIFLGPFSRSDSNSSLSDTLQGSSGLLLPPFANIDKIAMDVDSLSKQYAKLQERQKQACIILAGMWFTSIIQSTANRKFACQQLFASQFSAS